MGDVTIRYREVIYRNQSGYGRCGEYQVVQDRKILFRGDLRPQAENWMEERGYTLTSHDRADAINRDVGGQQRD